MAKELMTKVIRKQTAFTLSELKQIMDEMVEARKIIFEAQSEIDAQKDTFKDLKADQEDIITKCFENYSRGYSVCNVDCVVRYEGNVANYYDAKTGEKVEGVVLGEGEQLEMTGGKKMDDEDLSGDED